MIEALRLLYEGRSARAHGFRLGLLALDLAAIVYIVATSFVARQPWFFGLDLAFGALIVADFLARLALAPSKLRHFLALSTWADLVAMAAFLAPFLGPQFGFLRVLRTLRLLHAYPMLARLRAEIPSFKRNEEVILATANMLVFIFVMTGLIFALQGGTNPLIRNYADALYYTITTLTTTGYGDVTLTGTAGRMLSVVVMIVGVTLFLRLAQAMFRPFKVQVECPDCGLQLHDADAVHCKHCGRVIYSESDGMV